MTYAFFSDSFWLYYLTHPYAEILNHAIPRTTGMARSFALVSIFMFCYILYKNKLNFIYKLIFIFILLLLLTLIWGLQSRGALLCLIISFLLIIFFKNTNLMTKLIIILGIISLPYYLYPLIPKYKINIANLILISNISFEQNINLTKEEKDKFSEHQWLTDITKQTQKINKLRNNTITMDNKTKITSNQTNRFLENNNLELIGSGRFFIWKSLYKNYDLKNIFGYGPQADRYLLNNFDGNLSNNSSNGFVYAFISAGYPGLIISLLIYLTIIIKLIKISLLLFQKKIIPDYKNQTCVSILLFFSIRIFFENSFMNFGIDFIILMSCFFYLNLKYRKLENNYKIF